MGRAGEGEPFPGGDEFLQFTFRGEGAGKGAGLEGELRGGWQGMRVEH